MWTFFFMRFEEHNNIQLNKKVDYVMGMITRVINANNWTILRYDLLRVYPKTL